MTIDRKLWKPPFKDGLPSLPCCTCETGFLHPIADSIKTIETGSSEEARSHEAWEVEWIDNRFAGFYRCTNPKCRHVVSVAGKVSYETSYIELPTGDWDRTTDPVYTPIAFFEAPRVVRICEGCPDNVVEQLDRSFGLYWLDRRSCATAIRAAVELLLDNRDVARKVKNKSGKMARLSLHDRIVRFGESDPEPAKLLLAIKVIGNVGTHEDDITFDDLLTGYEILDHVIDVLYSGRAARVAGLADEVLARLGT